MGARAHCNEKGPPGTLCTDFGIPSTMKTLKDQLKLQSLQMMVLLTSIQVTPGIRIHRRELINIEIPNY